jgi:ubiquinone biosynthesis protein UbiJ
MAEIEHLLIEHFKALRAEIGEMKASLEEIITRLGRMELGIANGHRAVTYNEEAIAEHSLRLDRLNKRIERIEQRLEL